MKDNLMIFLGGVGSAVMAILLNNIPLAIAGSAFMIIAVMFEIEERRQKKP